MKIQEIVKKVLVSGRDYDVLPRTNKPTLLKSGAEIIAGCYNYRTSAQIINSIIDTEKQFAMYEVKVSVYDENGAVVAEGFGSCNSKENRYVKAGMYNSLNTVLKMAKKRAYVDAILTASKASYLFTQDLEDLPTK